MGVLSHLERCDYVKSKADVDLRKAAGSLRTSEPGLSHQHLFHYLNLPG